MMETIRRVFHVNRQDISYIRYTVESYDGMAVVATIDPRAAFIELSISPGCKQLVYELLDSLKIREGLYIKEIGLNKPGSD